MNLDDIIDIINNALRALLGFICEIIYPHMATLYELIMQLGKQIYSPTFEEIYNKISLIIGIFMVFRVTFWLLEALVNPDNISDKEKNPGKIVQKVLISVVLLAVTPTLFKYAFDVQNRVLNSQIIEKIVSVGDTEFDSVSTGRLLSAELFMNFYTANETYDGTIIEDDECSGYLGKEGIHYRTLKYSGELNLNNNCLTKKTEIDNNKYFVIDFNGIFAVAVGIFVFWMLLMYCISIGTRYVQLIYLQVIAPIPIMCYLTPGKDNMFSKWLKQCTTTYLDLFIRIAIINFVMVLCNMFLSNSNNIISNFGSDNIFLEIFLVLGLLTFAKKAPDLIQELLPKSVTKASGDFGLSWKKRTDSMIGGKYIYSAPKKAIGFAASLPGVGLSTAVRAYNTLSNNKRENNKLNKYRNDEKTRLENAKNNLLTKLPKSAKRDAAVNRINQKIDALNNMSNHQLRGELNKKNRMYKEAYNRIKDKPDSAADAALLMNRIDKNIDSGMNYRNQATAFATSVIGGTINATKATIQGKNIGDIVKKAHESNVKQIMREQEWYNSGGGTSFSDVIQRTISQVQRKFGIETEGQATQYVINELEADVKAQEEVVNTEKEKEQGYKTGKSSVEVIKSKGPSEFEKNKGIKFGNSTVVLSTRTKEMRAISERIKEQYEGFSTQDGVNQISGDKLSNLDNFIEIIARNSSSKVSEQEKVRKEMRAMLYDEVSGNVKNISTQDAYNKLYVKAAQVTSKAEADYGKEQSSAALIRGLMAKSGQNTGDMYKNMDVEDSYAALVREVENNKARYSDTLKNKLRIINNFLTHDEKGNQRANVLTTISEEDAIKMAGLIDDLEDQFKAESAKQSLVVAAQVDELQNRKRLHSATKNYIETKRAINADKYGGSGK